MIEQCISVRLDSHSHEHKYAHSRSLLALYQTQYSSWRLATPAPECVTLIGLSSASGKQAAPDTATAAAADAHAKAMVHFWN